MATPHHLPHLGHTGSWAHTRRGLQCIWGRKEEGPAALNLQVGPHTRVSPHSVPLEPESPGLASFPLTDQGWGPGDSGAGLEPMPTSQTPANPCPWVSLSFFICESTYNYEPYLLHRAVVSYSDLRWGKVLEM